MCADTWKMVTVSTDSRLVYGDIQPNHGNESELLLITTKSPQLYSVVLSLRLAMRHGGG